MEEDSARNALVSHRSPHCEEALASTTIYWSTEAPALRLADLDRARGNFTGTPIDFRQPCTGGRVPCPIIRHLPQWNEFLSAADLGLEEFTEMPYKLLLRSCKSAFMTERTEEQRHQAATLVFWLLKNHRCVVSLALGQNALQGHKALLCGGLRGELFIQALGLEFGTAETHKDLCALIPSMPLQHLACGSLVPCPPPILEAMTTLLQLTTSVTHLVMPVLHMEAEGARQFVGALRENRTLKLLLVQDSAVGEGFAEYLEKDAVLQVLIVSASYERSPQCLKQVLLGLEKNTTVLSVTLKNFTFDRECVEIVPRIFTNNRVLMVFNICSIQGNINSGFEHIYDRWLDALTQNETLIEVALNVTMWHIHQWKLFFDALSEKNTLRKVTIDTHYRDRHLLPCLCKVLTESSASKKVFLGEYNMGDDLYMLKCESFTHFKAQPSIGDKEKLVRIFNQLPLCDHFTAVTLDIWTPALNEAMAAAIASFIETTKALRTLSLSSQLDESNAQPTNEGWATIVESLSRNISISDLLVRKAHISDRVVELLARVIASSANIRKVDFTPLRKRDCNIFVRVLAENIADNYSLLSCGLDTHLDDATYQHWISVSEVMRRNDGLVGRAAVFARGTLLDGYCARALEQVWHHPGLMRGMLAKCLLTVDMVRARLSTIQSLDEYMRFAGVVSERVDCHPLPEGDSRPQLVDLGTHCWRHVSKYLVLDDIMEENSPFAPLMAASHRKPP